MLFNSFIFLIFLVLVVPAYFVLPRKWKNPLLLVASYFFYGYWDWRFTFLLALSTIIDYLVGWRLHHTQSAPKRKALLLLSLATNLGILGFFKYFNFFVDSFNQMSSQWGMPLDHLHVQIILPVGISFYTFQTLTYTIDIFRKQIKPTRSFIDFAVYVAFFPQLVAGPIERARHLLPQIALRENPTRENFREGFVLLSMGMFKKVLIGDTCGRLVDQIFATPQHYASVELLAGLVLFSLQIYNDFSGYSDIARGTAKFLGKDLMVNFNQPYLATNITDFWRRWHISLSAWLRDYLYVPLGGNRKGKTRTYINLMLTMLLGGLWHGASWNFVVWGGLHGLYLAVHKMILSKRGASEALQQASVSSRASWLGRVIATNILVLFTWLFFRAHTFELAMDFLKSVIAWSPSELTWRFLVITVSYGAVSLGIDALQYRAGDHAFLLRVRPAIRYGLLTVVWFFCLMYMFSAKPMPFIYFQF